MCHVLVIEDQPLIADLICEMLEDAGATSTQVAYREDEAIRCALSNPPTVITSDVRLSHGNGPKAVDAIRKELGPIPTIFITGRPDECEPCHHAVAILSKPFDVRSLENAFAEAWRASPLA